MTDVMVILRLSEDTLFYEQDIGLSAYLHVPDLNMIGAGGERAFDDGPNAGAVGQLIKLEFVAIGREVSSSFFQLSCVRRPRVSVVPQGYRSGPLSSRPALDGRAIASNWGLKMR